MKKIEIREIVQVTSQSQDMCPDSGNSNPDLEENLSSGRKEELHEVR